MRGRAYASHEGQHRWAVAPGDSGATFVELLVALAVFGGGLAMTAVAASVVLGVFEAEPAAADEQQRARAGLQVLIDDVARAGGGFYLDADDGPGVALPALVPDTLTPGTWTAAARPHTLSTWHARRDTPQAALAGAAAAGSTTLVLQRPPGCGALSLCGFQAGDDLLLAGPHGRVEFAEVRSARPPLDLDLTRPLASDWPAGAVIAAIVPHSYRRQADPATGLFQLVRSRGPGPATPVVDFVTRFDVEWWGRVGRPGVHLAPDGTEDHASAGPLPPGPGVVADALWPSGENCAFARDAAGVPAWRGSLLGAATPAPLSALADGPWCPSPTAATRWDADLVQVAEVRIVLGVAVASTLLRPPSGLGLSRGMVARPVPDLVLQTTVRPGRDAGSR